MPHFPPVLTELWQAVGKIADKLTVWLTAATYTVWHVLVFLFDKFVDLVKYIGDKL